MKTNATLLRIALMLLAQTLMGGLCDTERKCAPTTLLVPDDADGRSFSEVLSFPAGSYAVLKFACASLDRGNVVEVSLNGALEPIAQVYDDPFDTTSNDFLLLVRASDVQPGRAGVHYDLRFTVGTNTDEACDGARCVSAGDLELNIEEPSQAEESPLIRLSSSNPGALTVSSLVSSGDKISWLADGLAKAVPKYMPNPQQPTDLLNPNDADLRSFDDHPIEEKGYALVSFKKQDSRFLVSYQRLAFTPLTVSLGITPASRSIDADTIVASTEPGQPVVLTPQVSGGFLNQGASYEFNWIGKEGAMIDRTTGRLTYEDPQMGKEFKLTVKDSMNTAAAPTVKVEIARMLTVHLSGRGSIHGDVDGLVCDSQMPMPCQFRVAENSNVTLTASPEPNWGVEFRDDCQELSSRPPRASVTMNGNKTCSVTFKDPNMPGPSLTCRSEPGTVHAGQQVQLVASASGFTPPDYTWLLGAGVLYGSEMHVMDRVSALPDTPREILTHIKFPEVGLYTIRVYGLNGDEEVEGHCDINVSL